MITTTFDVVVVGAGAAGLMCAIEAGKRGRRVAVIEHADRAGKKILISGGGRCNFTNLYCTPENFLSANAHFAKSALARYTPADFLALVEAHGIGWHEKTLGQLFCDGSAQQIVAMLLAECAEAGVSILTRTAVNAVERAGPPLVEQPSPDARPVSPRQGFLLHTAAATLQTGNLVIASGGLSIPKMGASGFGYDLARQFNLNIRDCRPALVPLVLDEVDREGLCDLAGVSTEVTVSISKQRFREKLLVTHRGLSGPAVLQISSYWQGGESVVIDWVPECDLFAPLLAPQARRDADAAKHALRRHLPARLADRLIDVAAPSDWTNRGIAVLENFFHGWDVTPATTEGYEKAEVTAGGIDTSELSAQTMESRRIPGLYFIGEVVDVTGQLGGFNFQWAWASGAAAGRAV